MSCDLCLLCICGTTHNIWDRVIPHVIVSGGRGDTTQLVTIHGLSLQIHDLLLHDPQQS